MTPVPVPDPAERARRLERRRLARRLHPDLRSAPDPGEDSRSGDDRLAPGGDGPEDAHEAYVAALAAFDATTPPAAAAASPSPTSPSCAPSSAPSSAVDVVFVRSRRWGWPARLRHRVREHRRRRWGRL